MNRLDEIFYIRYGSQLDLNKCEICGVGEGYNFVNRSNANCGVSSRILRVEKKEPFKAGSITVAMGGSVLSSFVQQEDFYTGQNVKVLVPLKEMSLSEKLFYCQCIEANRFRFSTFGREANYTFDSLLVPSRDEVPPKIKKANTDLSFNSKSLSETKIKLNTSNWKWFRYDEIFEIKKGKRLTKADMQDGNIPYIGAIDSNNGISAYISNDEHLHQGNTITVSYNGSIAEAFYQTTKFWATDDVNVLYPKFTLNRYIAMFLITLIHREKYRFNYGRKWDKELMEASLIKLPAVKIAPNEYEPDWQFMEDYIKSLPYSSCL
ncbi:restriction endonuclease subunit S [Fibrobacter succinogenes]|uniref:Type I restriction modification DNA specificity domain-containing protein n=1 Tax=Fibrobacter succinogenes TaxID=833 RepID=A0A380RUI6_FIBSU|nr:restriction endonuclease subunit S [Fibrobacter succinogenes]PWJ36706.1 type I restriction modification DNA specificity protein [Fibrobacter succinogenes subsp. elongatus]SUQ18955.1 Type I restriction modification DNA specificity domain-containing protein [Fibrobacter succinogenes]